MALDNDSQSTKERPASKGICPMVFCLNQLELQAVLIFLISHRKAPARCTTRCARGAGVFHVHGQIFLSPCAVFKHLTTICPSLVVSPCAVAAG